MTHCVVSDDDSAIHDDERPAQKSLPRRILGGLALASIAFAYALAPYVDLVAIKDNSAPVMQPVELAKSIPSAASYFDVTLLDPARPLGFAPRTFSRSPPLRAELRPVTHASYRPDAAPQSPAAVVRTVVSVPLPTARPAGLGSPQDHRTKILAAAADSPFEKLFRKTRATSAALGYAPADGVLNNRQGTSSDGLPPNDGLTAIYDITARTVYLPDGTKLEAHSGFGEKMDNPRLVNVRMHGATPPHVYDLAPREALFHGDEALRMHPVGGAEAIHGRTGLLTHSYLLGPNGQSNGCVSFKDYAAFLRAYKEGKVRRMVVVASVDDPQVDLRIAARPPARFARTEFPAAMATAAKMPADDRYLAAFTSSLAWRTNSSARSLN